MSQTLIQSIDYPDLREALRKELSSSYQWLNLRAHQHLAPRHWGSFGGNAVIHEMLELTFEAIPSGKYDELFSWAKKLSAYGSDVELTRNVVLFLKQELETICSRVINMPSPLLGEISLRLLQLERIVTNVDALGWHTQHGVGHNPVDAAIDEITHLLNAKDYATGEHSRAVSSWCHRLALKLALPEYDVALVTRGGLIHDLGKSTVPLSVLAAPRRLTDEEWTLMASHVTAGYDMIVQMPALHEFQSMVRHHHERLDGGGYPDKLAGDEIPLLTRIVTVADCFNAMIGRRPYRKAMSPLAAIAEIQRHRGKQFDPDVADAMAEIAHEEDRADRCITADWDWAPVSAIQP